MQIILINLVRATQRLSKMDAQFAALKLPYTRLPATDGVNITENDRILVDNAKRKWFTPYPLSDNEIGCWLSHRNAMINILRSGELVGVVIEDDAELQPDFVAAIDAIAKSVNTFDFIFLHRKLKKNERFFPVKKLLPSLELGVVAPAHMGAIAYIVSREGARKFVSASTRLVHTVDKTMHRYWANGFSVYGLSHPVVVTNDEGYSYIEETRAQENNAATRPQYPGSDTLLWRLIRRLMRIVESIRKYSYFPFYLCARKCDNW